MIVYYSRISWFVTSCRTCEIYWILQLDTTRCDFHYGRKTSYLVYTACNCGDVVREFGDELWKGKNSVVYHNSYLLNLRFLSKPYALWLCTIMPRSSKIRPSWKNVEKRHKKIKSISMYKVLNDHTAPKLRASFIQMSESQNDYQLRNRETDLIIPKPKSEYLKKSFKYSGAECWVELSESETF